MLSGRQIASGVEQPNEAGHLVPDVAGLEVALVDHQRRHRFAPAQLGHLPQRPFRPGTAGGRELRQWLDRLVAELEGHPGRLADRGVRAMPIGDQMRLQLALIEEALRAVGGG